MIRDVERERSEYGMRGLNRKRRESVTKVCEWRGWVVICDVEQERSDCHGLSWLMFKCHTWLA